MDFLKQNGPEITAFFDQFIKGAKVAKEFAVGFAKPLLALQSFIIPGLGASFLAVNKVVGDFTKGMKKAGEAAKKAASQTGLQEFANRKLRKFLEGAEARTRKAEKEDRLIEAKRLKRSEHG